MYDKRVQLGTILTNIGCRVGLRKMSENIEIHTITAPKANFNAVHDSPVTDPASGGKVSTDNMF